jgi:hypothetical protein
LNNDYNTFMSFENFCARPGIECGHHTKAGCTNELVQAIRGGQAEWVKKKCCGLAVVDGKIGVMDEEGFVASEITASQENAVVDRIVAMLDAIHCRN